MSRPTLLIYGDLKDVSLKDASAIVRNLAERRCDTLPAAHIRLQKMPDGVAYEIQEGHGYSVMEAIQAEIEQSGDAWVRLANGRVAEVVRDGATYITVIHQDPPQGKTFIEPSETGKKMTPFLSDWKWVVTAGGVIAIGGALFFLLSAAIGAYAKGPSKPLVPVVEHALPSDELAQISLRGGEYIYALRFSDGEFRANIRSINDAAPEPADEPELTAESDTQPDTLPDPAAQSE
jgi:hypothetical protein